MTISWDFIREKEGSSRKGYVPAAATSQSGVTVGAGVDLGQRTPREIDALAISSDLKSKLKPYAGYKKQDAIDFLSQHPLELSDNEVQELDQAVRIPMIKNLANSYDAVTTNLDQSLKKFNQLPDAIQTAIASVAFQYGVNLARCAPRFWAAVTSQDWQASIRELENFGDAYKTRRLSEAALIRSVLDNDTRA